MRRHSEGVLPGHHVVPSLIAKVERHDPQRVIALLEPLVLERRRQRLLSVIGARLGSVQVVFDAPHDPHNGAAVVRSCEAFGVQRINVIERKEPFLLAPSVSRGSEKWVDLRHWQKAEEAITTLREEGYELVGAHAEGELGASGPRVHPAYRDRPRQRTRRDRRGSCACVHTERAGADARLRREPQCVRRRRGPPLIGHGIPAGGSSGGGPTEALRPRPVFVRRQGG